MRIAVVNLPIEYYSPVRGGAVATVIRAVGRELVSAGHEVHILTRSDGCDYPDGGQVVPLGPVWADSSLMRRAAARMTVLRGKSEPFSGYADWVSCVQEQLIQLGPDAVVVHNDPLAMPWIREVAGRVPVVLWAHNLLSPQNRTQMPDVIVTVSDFVRRHFAAAGVAEERLHVALNGVDAQAFRPRSNWLDPPRAPRAVVLGRFDPNKGPDIALAAVDAVRQRGVRLDVTLAGGPWWYGGQEDAYAADLRSTVRELDGIDAGMVPRHQVPSLLASHDVSFVLSRSPEPFAMVVLESMAAGCAVIASRRGGIPEAAGGAATLVDPDCLDEVTDALAGLVCDPGRLFEAKRRSRERAVKQPWSSTASVLTSALERF